MPSRAGPLSARASTALDYALLNGLFRLDRSNPQEAWRSSTLLDAGLVPENFEDPTEPAADVNPEDFSYYGSAEVS